MSTGNRIPVLWKRIRCQLLPHLSTLNILFSLLFGLPMSCSNHGRHTPRGIQLLVFFLKNCVLAIPVTLPNGTFLGLSILNECSLLLLWKAALTLSTEFGSRAGDQASQDVRTLAPGSLLPSHGLLARAAADHRFSPTSRCQQTFRSRVSHTEIVRTAEATRALCPA